MKTIKGRLKVDRDGNAEFETCEGTFAIQDRVIIDSLYESLMAMVGGDLDYNVDAEILADCEGLICNHVPLMIIKKPKCDFYIKRVDEY